MNARRTLCLLMLALPWLSAHATEPGTALLDRIRRRLASAPVLRFDFEQRKTIRGFRNPLVSRGALLLARGRGLIWHTREPFESSVVVTPERVSSRLADGSTGMRLDARDQPALRAINDLLFALLTVDLVALTPRFGIDGNMSDDGAWRLRLLPRDAALAQWMANVEIEGDAHVRVLRLQEARGDHTAIRFERPRQDTSLTPGEEASFG